MGRFWNILKGFKLIKKKKKKGIYCAPNIWEIWWRMCPWRYNEVSRGLQRNTKAVSRVPPRYFVTVLRVFQGSSKGMIEGTVKKGLRKASFSEKFVLALHLPKQKEGMFSLLLWNANHCVLYIAYPFVYICQGTNPFLMDTHIKEKFWLTVVAPWNWDNRSGQNVEGEPGNQGSTKCTTSDKISDRILAMLQVDITVSTKESDFYWQELISCAKNWFSVKRIDFSWQELLFIYKIIFIVTKYILRE